MNINSILKELGISKLKAAWTLLTKGLSGLIELLAKAFTALLRKANPDKLSNYAEITEKIAKFTKYGVELFVKNEDYKKAGILTAQSIGMLALHISDGEYTKEELNDDIDSIDVCIKQWKEVKKCESQAC